MSLMKRIKPRTVMEIIDGGDKEHNKVKMYDKEAAGAILIGVIIQKFMEGDHEPLLWLMSNLAMMLMFLEDENDKATEQFIVSLKSGVAEMKKTRENLRQENKSAK